MRRAEHPGAWSLWELLFSLGQKGRDRGVSHYKNLETVAIGEYHLTASVALNRYSLTLRPLRKGAREIKTLDSSSLTSSDLLVSPQPNP